MKMGHAGLGIKHTGEIDDSVENVTNSQQSIEVWNIINANISHKLPVVS